jgi:ferrochelatase
MTRTGLVVMAYGTPRSPEDVEAYYTDIRRGRPPTAEQLADLKARYDAIGGISPLAERTEAQRAALAAALEARAPGRFEVVLGQKHAAPFVEDAVRSLADQGIDRAVGLVLAPHYSAFSVGQYHERAAAAGAECGVELLPIDSWHLEPAFLDFLTDALRAARAELPAGHKVLFTAHSLPERVGMLPWPEWAIAWQSAGRTPEPWRGPDILQVIRELGETGRGTGVAVCAQGFTSDHLEVLYDLDIEARRVAEEHGLAFARTRSLNDDPAVMAALADLVLARADEG